MTLAAELLQTEKSRYAGNRTRRIRKIMTERGVSALVRTSATTLVTTIVIFSPEAEPRAAAALADLPVSSIRIVVRRNA